MIERPRCACGCGQPARIVADVRIPDGIGIDCRAPWADSTHASDVNALALQCQPDVILSSADLDAVLRLDELAPCWCGIENLKCSHGALTYRTRLPWCPKHGART